MWQGSCHRSRQHSELKMYFVYPQIILINQKYQICVLYLQILHQRIADTVPTGGKAAVGRTRGVRQWTGSACCCNGRQCHATTRTVGQRRHRQSRWHAS